MPLHRPFVPPCLCACVPLVLLLLPFAARADITLSLPLEGYYRPGKYMPVQFSGSGAGQLAIGDPANVQTFIPLAENARGIAPAILLEPASNLPWHNGDLGGALPLKLLSPQQRLIGFTTPDPTSAQTLFPDRDLIPVRLDPANLLPGPVAAWGILDALLLDSSARLTREQISILLAGGTTIAIRSSEPPDKDWPWEKRGDLQILHLDLAGPRWGGENIFPFDPVAGWQADWPASFRRRIFLYAVIFSILAAGASLIRLKYSGLIVVAGSILAVILLAIWWHGRSAVLEKSAMVSIVSPTLTQTDAWSCRASASPADASTPWDVLTWPFFEEKTWPYLHLALHCKGDGSPDLFSFRCIPSFKIAFLSRVVDRQKPAGTPQAVLPDSPLFLLRKRTYGMPNLNPLGQIPSPGEASKSESEWLGSLLIERQP
jgi:hypothetical protein